MSAPSAVYSESGSLKEEVEAKQALEKSNFDLKMKVYYLEENLRRAAAAGVGGVVGSSSSSSSSSSELSALNSTLRVQLEEKNVELEQRAGMIRKAFAAIEGLKKEVERLRGETQSQHELEDRVRKLKTSNEGMESEFRVQLSALETQLQTARQTVTTKEKQRSELESRVSQLELSLAHANDRLEELRDDKDQVDEQWLQMQQRNSEMEEELTQARAHVDLYRIQYEEQVAEVENVKHVFQESTQSKKRGEEELRAKLAEVNAHYESQIRTMRHLHEQDMEKLREGHALMLTDVRENATLESERLRTQMEAAAREMRITDMAEASRIREDAAKAREDFLRQVHEKSEEVKTMRSMLEGDRARVDGLSREAEAARVECRIKHELAEQFKAEIVNLGDEVKTLRKSHELCAELKEGLRREQIEKAHLSAKVDQVSQALAASREELRELEAARIMAENEARRVSQEGDALLHRLQPKVDSVEEVSRENEKLKSINASLKSELQEAGHKISDLSRDLLVAKAEMEKASRDLELGLSLKKTELDSARAELQRSLEQNSSEVLAREDVKATLLADRQRLGAAEAALAEQRVFTDSMQAEHRTVVAELRAELDLLVQAKALVEKDKAVAEREYMDSRLLLEKCKEDLSKAALTSFEVMAEWDATLTDVLDGSQALHHNNELMMNGAGVNRRVGGNSMTPLSTKSARLGLFSQQFTHPASALEPQHLPNPEELAQAMAVLADRVQTKIDRVARMRAVFDAQAQRLADGLRSVVEAVQEKSSLLFHKVADAQLRVDGLKQVVDRDRRLHEGESSEMRAFRAEVMAEHATRLQEAEHKQAALAHAIELEKLKVEQAHEKLESFKATEIPPLLARAEQAENETKIQQKLCDELREELEEYAHAESIVAGLAQRITDLEETNSQLARQIEEREETLANTKANIDDLASEKASLLSAVERGRTLLQTRESSLREAEARIVLLVQEVERLGARQINPELAQTLKETDSLLRVAVTEWHSPGSASRTTLDRDLDAEIFANEKEDLGLPRSSGSRSSSSNSGSSGSSNITSNGDAGSGTSTSPSASHYYQHMQSVLLGGELPVSSSTTTPTHGINFSTLKKQRELPASVSSLSSSPFGTMLGKTQQQLGLRAPTPAQVTFAPSVQMTSPYSSTSPPQASPSLRTQSKLQAYSPFTSSNFLRTAPSSAAPTPNTVMVRASVSRLNRLGSDLENLARRLDQFSERKK